MLTKILSKLKRKDKKNDVLHKLTDKYCIVIQEIEQVEKAIKFLEEDNKCLKKQLVRLKNVIKELRNG